jgi:hypothetical protein
MNRRFLPCKEKEVIAIGAENSINDCKEKIFVCFDCYKFLTCKASQSIFKAIKSQQDAFIYLRKQDKQE